MQACFIGLLADFDPANWIKIIIERIFAGLSEFLGALAEELQLHIIMIATIVEEVIKAIVGPIYEAIIFIAEIIVIALTKPAELLQVIINALGKIAKMIVTGKQLL